jgi:diguanylate cyclase
MEKSFGFYQLLDRIGPRSYVGKFLVVAFWATHLPLISLVILLIVRPTGLTNALALTVLVLATVLGTALSFYAFRSLLVPVLFVRRELRAYLDTHTPPILPTQFRDEAGALLRDTDFAIRTLHQQQALLQSYADQDYLTRLTNRRAAEVVLQEQLVQGQSFLVALIDVDHFKLVNDLYGHPAGDRVLVQLSQVLTEQVPNALLITRWGGEEFLVCLEDMAEGKLAVLEHLREAISERVLLPETERRLTVSMGVTYTQTGDTVASLISRADQALYRAKAKGRDCLVLEEELRQAAWEKKTLAKKS